MGIAFFLIAWMITESWPAALLLTFFGYLLLSN